MHPNPLWNKKVSLRIQAQYTNNTLLSLDDRNLEQSGQGELQQRKTILCNHHEIHSVTGGDAAWLSMGTCALLQCLTASPIWMNQPTWSLKWSVKGTECYQAIFLYRKVGDFFPFLSLSLFFNLFYYYFLNWQPSFLLLADGWTVPWKHDKAIASGTKGWVHSFLPICFGCHFKGRVAR